MDISDFDTVAEADAGAKMEVRNPKTGEVLRHAPDEANPEGRPFTVSYVGKDSPKVQDVARKQVDRRIAQMRRTNQAVSVAITEADAVDLLVACTTGWDIFLGGKAPEFDAKACRAAYVKYPWLFEQGNEFTGLRANFSKA
jgi:hypothetical protein